MLILISLYHVTSLSLSCSVTLSVYPYATLSLYQFILMLYRFINLSLSHAVALSVYPCTTLSLLVYPSTILTLSIYPSIPLLFYPSNTQSMYKFSISITFSVYLSPTRIILSVCPSYLFCHLPLYQFIPLLLYQFQFIHLPLIFCSFTCSISLSPSFE